MGQMNIKDDLLIEKIKRLAERKGTSATEALRIAVDGELARDEAEVKRRYDTIMEIAARTAPLLAGPDEDYDHGRLLYDPGTGLPR